MAEYMLSYTGQEIDERLKKINDLNTNINTLNEELDKFGGTIEVTSGEPNKENTIITINPSGEEVNIYTTTEVNSMVNQISEELNNLNIPTKTSDLENNSGFLTSVPSEYVTDTELNAKGYLTQHQDLSAYAKKTEIPSVPTKTSQLANDSGYLTSIPSEYITETELSARNYLTSIPSEYVTETELNNKGYATQTEVNQLSKEIVNLNIPTKTSDLSNDSGFLTEIPSEYVTDEELTIALAKLEQTELVFVQSEDEMTDESKVYVYNGFIWTFGKKIIETEGGTIPAFTNVKDQCYFKYGYRYSLSSNAYKALTGTTTIVVPVPSDSTSVVIRFKGVNQNTSYYNSYGGTSGESFTNENTIGNMNQYGQWEEESAGVYKLEITKASTDTYLSFHVLGTSASDFANVIVTVNEEIAYTTSTETEEVEAFMNTGVAFAPADYEDKIIALEKTAEQTAEHEDRLDALENQVGTVDENTLVHTAIGTTYCPTQRPADSRIDGSDIYVDLYVENDTVLPANGATSDDIHAYIETVTNNFTDRVTKEILGKDASGSFDICRYTICNRQHIAWQKQNYPKMYAWKNGSTVIYSTSISPRIGDTMYSTKYIGTAYSTVTAVNATNRSRTVNSLEFVRYESGDVEPTITYTDVDDERNSNTTITKGGVTYNRYPFGDLLANKTKPVPIFIYANEHGVVKKANISEGTWETKLCALVASRMVRDLALEKQSANPLIKYIIENCILIVIPVVNPWGYNHFMTSYTMTDYYGYHNYNDVNINRNYDTPGWDYMLANGTGIALGDYAGSEIETQYVMNTMVESGAVVAMSLHGLGGWIGYCCHQGQKPDGSDYNRDKLAKVYDILYNNFGIKLRYYDLNSDGTPQVAVNTPDITSKSPSYITQCGAHGGIVEFQPVPVGEALANHSMSETVIETAYCETLNLMAMWLSDYLESI